MFKLFIDANCNDYHDFLSYYELKDCEESEQLYIRDNRHEFDSFVELLETEKTEGLFYKLDDWPRAEGE